MTPLELAKRECADWQPDGSCLGRTDRTDDRCLLRLHRRCPYFERAVLPLADAPSPSGAPRRQRNFRAARAAYFAEHEEAPAPP